jgi:hypothetical protein
MARIDTAQQLPGWHFSRSGPPRDHEEEWMYGALRQPSDLKIISPDKGQHG